MRQRKVKNEAIRLAAVEYLQIKTARESRVLARFPERKNYDFTGDIFLEIGCGGHFLASGQANPNHFYFEQREEAA